MKLDPAGLLFQSGDGGFSIAAKRHGAIIHFFTRDAGALDSFARSNLGMGAPIEPCTGVVEGGRRLMFSAPEEWTLSSDTPLSVSTLKSLPPSVRWVEVTDGYVTFSAQGVHLGEFLSLGCPLTLSDLPQGGCARTFFLGFPIWLNRIAEDAVHVCVSRSVSLHFAEFCRRQFLVWWAGRERETAMHSPQVTASSE